MRRVIVAGSRTFNDYNQLSEVLDKIIAEDEYIEFVSGGARGADSLCEQYAKEHGFKISIFPAEWDTYGRSAGMRRNADMAKYAAECNGMLIAFWDGQSRGTKGMIDLAYKYNIEVDIITY